MKVKLPPGHLPANNMSVVALSSVVEWPKCQKSIEAVLQRGYKLKFDKDNLTKSHGYLAGDDDFRMSRFQDALHDENSSAIFCARGGYGVTRLIENIDPDEIRQNPKWLIGFSDVTALGMVFNAAGLVWLHAPLFTTLHKEPDAVFTRLFKFLETPKSLIGEQLLSGEPYIHGSAEGVLWGGNLTMIISMMGSQYFPDMSGKILFIEETGEEPYRLDRSLTQLRLCGALHEAAGVIVGYMTGCNPKLANSFVAEEVIKERLGDLDIPVMLKAPIGHEQPNYPLPVGANVRLDTTSGSLTLLDYNGEI